MRLALLVGINYFNTGNELKGCINDIVDVKDFLINDQKFPPNNIISLRDDQQNNLPTRDNILNNLTALVSQMKSGDIMYFHYSGHGANVKDAGNDEIDGLDETIIPVDFEKSGVILDDDIRKIINNVPQGAKFIGVSDSCHSATTFDLRYLYDPVSQKICKKREFEWLKIGKRIIRPDKNLQVLDKYLDTRGEIVMLSGCEDFQTSADTVVNGKAAGALTAAFLDTLRKNGGNISYRDLPIKTRDFIKNNKLSNQIPRLSFGRSDFLLDKKLF